MPTTLPEPDLDRFVQAQAPVMDAVRAELTAGRKRTHWMWFVFPQLRGLGHSPTAQFYGLTGAAEAGRFLAHPVLGPRLRECTGLVAAHRGRSALDILGAPDDLKFRSCMTLFRTLEAEPFEAALAHFFGGVPDPKTQEMLRAA